jgi:hypothetical protein
MNDQILSLFKKEVNQADLVDANQEIEDSVEAITKAGLMELRALSRPHLMIEKCV